MENIFRNKFETIKKKLSFKTNPKIKKYEKLSFILIILFTGERLNSDDIELLSQREKLILKAIVFRKSKKFINISSENVFIANQVNQIFQNGFSKKNEDSFKFIYKRTIKLLKKKFFLNYKIKPKTKSVMQNAFLKYYFEEISKNENLPLTYFNDPLIQRNKKKMKKNEKCCKSINQTFLSQVFKSKNFVNDFFEYVDTDFKKDYFEEVPKKIFNILEEFIKAAISNEEILKYFVKTEKFKLPWISKNISIAIQTIKEISSNTKKS